MGKWKIKGDSRDDRYGDWRDKHSGETDRKRAGDR
jgi:hypothetical protein